MDKSCFIEIVEAGLTCKDCVYFSKDSTGYLQCNNLQYIEVEEAFLCNKFKSNSTIMKGSSGKEYNLKVGDSVIHPSSCGSKEETFIVEDYDVLCREIIRHNGVYARPIDLDICQINSSED